MDTKLQRHLDEALILFGLEVKLARLERGITAGELGERIGVSRQTIVALENGTFGIATGTAFAAALALDIPLYDGRARQQVKSARKRIGLLPRDPRTIRKMIAAAEAVAEKNGLGAGITDKHRQAAERS